MILNANKDTLLGVEASDFGPNGEFEVPESVTVIAHSVFRLCTTLTGIILHERVTEIGEQAFYGCTNLTSISIPKRVMRIGEGAFYRCTSLTNIIIPDGVTVIEALTFAECCNLTRISISKGVTKIRYRAFCDSGLTSIIIPDGVTEIEGGAFLRTYLASIVIPDSLTTINADAFDDCIHLQIVINTKDESKLEQIKRLLPEKLKQRLVPMAVYAKAKQLKERLLDDFCNYIPHLHPLDGHQHLCADVIGAIAAWNAEIPLDRVAMPTSDLLSEYESYEMALKQMQARHVALISLYVEPNPLYSLKNHLLKYKQIMETPKKPSNLSPIGFFSGQRPDVHSKYLSTWIRHQTLTKILNWIEQIIDRNHLLENVPDLALTEEEKTAIRTSQLLMAGDFMPVDFDFKAMLSQEELPSASAVHH